VPAVAPPIVYAAAVAVSNSNVPRLIVPVVIVAPPTPAAASNVAVSPTPGTAAGGPAQLVSVDHEASLLPSQVALAANAGPDIATATNAIAPIVTSDRIIVLADMLAFLSALGTGDEPAKPDLQLRTRKGDELSAMKPCGGQPPSGFRDACTTPARR
jgi:hypothetical protein